MQALIDELHESWINGNRRYVLDMITGWSGAQAVLAGALLCNAMGTEDKQTLFRLLSDRINER